ASVTVTDVREVELPREFSLGQNYPNPFNPTTTISYTIPSVETTHVPSLQHVTLKVFDVLGKEIATLVNEKLIPGKYTETFSGTNLPSGIYFYVLRTGTFTSVKKMVLLK
ncbi:MAG: T9SS type A sorting domain-containing protein, partial [Bacteroidetes bacterium]|nr:T9SS type A sorting domain-containing protein [Bacteroidota bacterium]